MLRSFLSLLLVLYCCCRLRCVVVKDSVDAGNFVSDTVCDAAHEVVIDGFNCYLDYVSCVDRTYNAEPLESSLAVLDACGLEVRYYCEVLPYLACKACLLEFLSEDSIGFSYCFESVSCDCAGASYTKSGTGERLTVYHLVGKAKSRAYYTDLVLVEILNGFNELEIEFRRKSANVVVSLDALFALEDIRIDGALREECDAVELCSFFSKDLDELFADDVTLLLRIRYERERKRGWFRLLL